MHRQDKPIRYHVHAKRRMRRRGISEIQVERAIREPDVVRPARRQGAQRFEKRLSKRRRLTVIAEVEKRETWVITAW